MHKFLEFLATDQIPLLLTAVAVVLVGVLALQAVQGFIRLFLPMVSATVATRVGAALARAIRERRDPAAAVRTLAPQVPWPFSWRLQAAGTALAAQGSAGLAPTLARHGLLPQALVPSGVAAERLGAMAVAEWAEAVAQRSDLTRALLIPLAPFFAVFLLVLLNMLFIGIVIVPKFEQICRELGQPLEPRLLWLGHLPPLSVMLVGGIAGISIAWIVIMWWRWRGQRRLLAARVVLAGVAGGASEAELATALAQPAPPDFSALMTGLGWSGSIDPLSLDTALAHAEESDARRLSWLRIALQITIPLLLAVPVWLVASGVFGALIQILTTLASDEGIG